MTYKDTALYCKLRVLCWITYDHLEIKMSNRVDEMWVIAAKELMNMDHKKTPIEKCECMLRCNKIMNDVFNITSDKKDKGADDIFPLYIYILLKA